MIPLSNTFTDFCAWVLMTEEDLKEYLEEPAAALPPSMATALPKISILLVPYLERANKTGSGRSSARATASEFVSIEKPPGGRTSTSPQISLRPETVFASALKHHEVAEYHYRLYPFLSSPPAGPS